MTNGHYTETFQGLRAVFGGFEEEVFNDDSEKQVFVCQCKFGY